MDECRVTAPAKINLSLDITGSRHDGYHLLRMVMQSVSLCDTLVLRKKTAGEITFSCDRDGVPVSAENLAVRAAHAFFTYTRLTDAGVDISLEKRIPIQAGLGGGSTDAAATLVGLNALFQTGLDTRTLCGIGLYLGADVPFTLKGGAALCEGIGEIMQPLPSLADCFFVIAKPEIGIITKEAFAHYDTHPPSRRPDTELVAAAVAAGDLRSLGSAMCNVLEEVCLYPEVFLLKKRLMDCHALGALMTGSGSAVFGLFDEKSAAKRCLSVMKEHAKEVYLAEPCACGVSLS